MDFEDEAEIFSRWSRYDSDRLCNRQGEIELIILQIFCERPKRRNTVLVGFRVK